MPWLSIARRDGADGPEWRKSDWPVTDHLNGGRACPRCHVTVHKGARWRAHWAWHAKLDAQRAALDLAVTELAAAVRRLSLDLGHDDWYAPAYDEAGSAPCPVCLVEIGILDGRFMSHERYAGPDKTAPCAGSGRPAPDDDDDEAAPLTGFVIGSGELPPETRGGDD